MKKEAIYLDYNASAPLLPQALAVMQATLAQPGNASSIHGFGRHARQAVEQAREQVAALAGTHANQVAFTSGATESNNAVLKHFAGQRILVSAIEHPSVLESAPDAERIPVTQAGVVDMAAFEKMLQASAPPALVSVMLVNNETGVIQPVAELARLAKKHHPGVFIHTDAVQAAGRMPLEMAALYADYLSLSSHKIGGPQGTGALLSAPGAPVPRLLHGGGQEKRQRAGTENVAGIAGFGAAAAYALSHLETFRDLVKLRDQLEKSLQEIAPDTVVFGAQAPRVANTLNIGVPGANAQTFLMALDLEGLAVSSGSACSSGTVKPSHVLAAMGVDPALSAGALRFSLGWDTRPGDITAAAAAFKKVIDRVRR